MKNWSELPRALQPWAEYLQLLPHEQVVAFAPLVQRLDIAIGPFAVHARGGEGEPDGFDGLTRRGSYDRLLLSEWLLADAMPEEFMRRAVMSEHAFLQIARQEPAGARVSFALFDAGPNQLGAPRIAHLAALIVLARRAEAVGARFEWGIIQHPDEPPYRGVSAANLALLFRARCAHEATGDHLATWQQRVLENTANKERWLIGGDRLAALPGAIGSSLLMLTDPLIPGCRALTAEIRSAGRSPAFVTLDLPDDPACVRLFREPAHDVAPPRARLPALGQAPTSNLLFLPGGTKLAGRLSGAQLAAYPVPNSPWAGQGKTRSIQASSRRLILAVGRIQRKYVVATVGDMPDTIQIEWVDQKRVYRFTLPPSMSMPAIQDNSPVESLFWIPNAEKGTDTWFLSLAGKLLQIEFRGTYAAVATVVCDPLRCVVEWPGGDVTWIGKRNGQWMLSARLRNGEHVDYRTFEAVEKAFFGTSGHVGQRRLAAFPSAEAAWTLVTAGPITDDDQEDQVVHVSGRRVVGMYGQGRLRALVQVRDDRKTVDFWRQDTSGILFKTDAAILRIAVSPYLPGREGLSNIAYLTEKQEMNVFSLGHQANVLTYSFPPLPNAVPDRRSPLIGDDSI